MSPRDGPMSADAPERPPIVLSRSDRTLLERAAIESLLRAPRVAGGLLDELRRARVVADEDLDPDIVRLGARVTFREGADGRPQTTRLVGPDQVVDDAQDTSVLSSIGAALLGLQVGQSIRWRDRVGGEQVLTIVGVAPPSAAPRGR